MKSFLANFYDTWQFFFWSHCLRAKLKRRENAIGADNAIGQHQSLCRLKFIQDSDSDEPFIKERVFQSRQERGIADCKKRYFPQWKDQRSLVTVPT